MKKEILTDQRNQAEGEESEPMGVGDESELKEALDLNNLSSANLDKVIDEVLGPLADDYSIRILAATREEGKTVRQLSRDLDVPIATCYRRVKELVDANLLEVVDRKLTQEGKRATVLRTNVSFIQVAFKFEDRELKISIEPSEE